MGKYVDLDSNARDEIEQLLEEGVTTEHETITGPNSGPLSETKRDHDELYRVSDGTFLGRPHDVRFANGYWYVVGKTSDSGSGSFAIISDVYESLTGGLSSLNNAQSVYPAPPYCYVADDDGLHTIDVSSPASPSKAGLASDTNLARINGIDRRENLVVAESKDGHLYSIDVSDPESPNIIDNIDTDTNFGTDAPHDVALVNGHALLVNNGTGATNKVTAIPINADGTFGSSVADHVTSTEVSNQNNTGSTADEFNRIKVGQGSVAYIAALSNHIVVVDVSDPTAMSVKEVQGSSLGPGISYQSPYLYVYESEQCTRYLTPDAPRISELTKDAVFSIPTPASSHDLEVVGGRMALTHDPGSGGNLIVVDVGETRAAGIEASSLRANAVHSQMQAASEIRAHESLHVAGRPVRGGGRVPLTDPASSIQDSDTTTTLSLDSGALPAGFDRYVVEFSVTDVSGNGATVRAQVNQDSSTNYRYKHLTAADAVNSATGQSSWLLTDASGSQQTGGTLIVGNPADSSLYGSVQEKPWFALDAGVESGDISLGGTLNKGVGSISRVELLTPANNAVGEMSVYGVWTPSL